MEETKNYDENDENWNNAMVGEFLDDVFDSEDEDWNNLELYSSKGKKKEVEEKPKIEESNSVEHLDAEDEEF